MSYADSVEINNVDPEKFKPRDVYQRFAVHIRCYKCHIMPSHSKVSRGRQRRRRFVDFYLYETDYQVLGVDPELTTKPRKRLPGQGPERRHQRRRSRWRGGKADARCAQEHRVHRVQNLTHLLEVVREKA